MRGNEDKNKTWYAFDNEDAFLESGDPDKAIYRFVPFDILLQMLNEKRLYLAKTVLWEDVYENFIFKEKVFCGGKAKQMEKIAGQFYGQCWTYKKSSDALWRIYSPDRKSVRIKTRQGKLAQALSESGYAGPSVSGKVRYFPQSKIEADIRNLPTISADKFVTLAIQSLFVKRNSFSHESEFRLICFTDKRTAIDALVIPIPINPQELIEGVYFDPRAEDAYVNRCTKILVNAFSYPAKQIKKSKLYSFNTQTINYIEKD